MDPAPRKPPGDGHSVPPPSRAPAPPSAAGQPPIDDREAEALRKVAALAAERSDSTGPPRALTTALIALGVLLVAILMLAAVISIGR